MTKTSDSIAGDVTFVAACHCRRSTLSFTVPATSLPLPVHFCHCDICRHTHGTLCSVHANIPRPKIDFSSYTEYHSSDKVSRWFCSTCGAHVVDRAIETQKDQGTDHEPLNLEKWHIAVCLVEAGETVWDFQSHIFVDSTRDGGLAILLPQIGNKKLKLWKRKPVATVISAEPGDWSGPIPQNVRENAITHEHTYLEAKCHCGGISFFISRPTEEHNAAIPSSLRPTDDSKYPAIHDACTTCRLTLSSFPVSWLFVPKAALLTCPVSRTSYPEDGILGTAKSYTSSEGVRRTFCGRCGAGVAYSCADRPDLVDIAAGLLQLGSGGGKAQGVRAEEWIEWKTVRVGWEGDALWKESVLALKEGLRVQPSN